MPLSIRRLLIKSVRVSLRNLKKNRRIVQFETLATLEFQFRFDEKCLRKIYEFLLRLLFILSSTYTSYKWISSGDQ